MLQARHLLLGLEFKGDSGMGELKIIRRGAGRLHIIELHPFERRNKPCIVG
jgi:hypothetical protein